MKVKILRPKSTKDYQHFGINSLFPYVGKIVPVIDGNKHSMYVRVKIENRICTVLGSCCKFISLKSKLK